MRSTLESEEDRAAGALRAALDDNLYSCCLYGSLARGNQIEGHSNINLLIVLNESTLAAHQAIAKTIGGNPKIDPFVVARASFARTVDAFATKFASIQRNYRVLCGADPLAGVQINPQLARFHCEQEVRNLRLRLAYTFVTRQRHKTYARFLARSVTPLFTQLGEALRLEGLAIPKLFHERIGIFEKQLGIDSTVLHELLALKTARRTLSEAEAAVWHERMISLLDGVLAWIEAHWRPIAW
jgi:hypothetical protein